MSELMPTFDCLLLDEYLTDDTRGFSCLLIDLRTSTNLTK